MRPQLAEALVLAGTLAVATLAGSWFVAAHARVAGARWTAATLLGAAGWLVGYYGGAQLGVAMAGGDGWSAIGAAAIGIGVGLVCGPMLFVWLGELGGSGRRRRPIVATVAAGAVYGAATGALLLLGLPDALLGSAGTRGGWGYVGAALMALICGAAISATFLALRRVPPQSPLR